MVKDMNDPYLVHVTYYRVFLNSICSLLLSFLGIFVGMVQYEWVFGYGSKRMNEQRMILVSISFVFSFCLMMLCYFRYELLMKHHKTAGRLTKGLNLISSGYWKWMLLEMLMAIIGPFPFFHGLKLKNGINVDGKEVDVDLNSLLLALSLFL